MKFSDIKTRKLECFNYLCRDADNRMVRHFRDFHFMQVQNSLVYQSHILKRWQTNLGQEIKLLIMIYYEKLENYLINIFYRSS